MKKNLITDNPVSRLIGGSGKAMINILRNASKSSGLPPGSVVYTGRKKDEPVAITVFDYNEKECRELTVDAIEDCFAFRDTDSVTWINVGGIHRTDIIEKLGAHFNLHPLTQEDIVNTHQRPKLEEFDDYLFMIMKMIYNDPDGDGFRREQVSLIVASHFVISFQEEPGDVWDPVRERIRNSLGRIRKVDNDYLAYALADAVVDNYFTVLERQGDRLEELDGKILADPDEADLQEIHRVKRDLAVIRKSVWPLRDVINSLVHSENRLIRKTTVLYLRDVYDHIVQVIETTETFRDMAAGLLDLYMTMISNKMNDIMKVLTIIATIFIPLTFVAGIYGMNFEWIPELKLKWGYPAVWGVMLVLAGVMVVYFKKKKWF